MPNNEIRIIKQLFGLKSNIMWLAKKVAEVDFLDLWWIFCGRKLLNFEPKLYFQLHVHS